MTAFVLALICGADIWVYREPDDYHDTKSELLYEALCEPIESLSARLPDHEPMRKYLKELQKARDDLRALGEVTVKTRDEARLYWEVPCPSLGLTEYETPRPIIEDAYLHPVLIVRHLEYISKLADLGNKEQAGRFPYLTGLDKFVEWQTVMVTVTDYEGLQQTETLERMVPRIEPVPAIDMPEPPVRISVEWHSRHKRAWYTDSDRRVVGGDTQEWLRALDGGQGIISK